MTNITGYTINEAQTIINNLENTINQMSTGMTTMMIILGIIILGLGVYIYTLETKKKRTKEYNEARKELEEAVKKIIETDKKLGTGEINVNEIRIEKMPQELKAELYDKTNILNKLFTGLERTKEPFLLLIRENGKIEVMKRIREGEREIKTKDGTKKLIIIDASKKHHIQFGGKQLPCYIHYENEAEGYPIEPQHHSKTLYQMISAIKLAEGLLEQPRKGIPKIIIVGVIVIIVGIAIYMWWNGQATPETTQAAAQIAANVTETIKI